DGCEGSRREAPHGVAVNVTRSAPRAGLWAEAARVRAYRANRPSDGEVAAAVKGLRRFLATPTPGVWFDKLAPEDVFVHEPARATSLYHIIGAAAELSDAIAEAENASLPVRRPAPRA